MESNVYQKIMGRFCVVYGLFTGLAFLLYVFMRPDVIEFFVEIMELLNCD